MKEEPLSDPEPRFKFDDTSNVKIEDQKSKVEEKPMVKQEEKPNVHLEEKPTLTVEENVKVKPERMERESVKVCPPASAFALPTAESLEVFRHVQWNTCNLFWKFYATSGFLMVPAVYS